MTMRHVAKIGAAALALLGAAAAAGAAGAQGTAPAPATAHGPLTFCVGTDNFPMSVEDGPTGFEVDLARALAARLGREARFEWIDPHRDFAEKSVLEGRCDAAMGAIVEMGAMPGAQPINGVTLTAPYYSAGYLLVRRPGARAVGTLEDLRGTRIALEGESLGTYTLRQQGHQVYVLRDFDAVIGAVAAGRAEYGYLWGPLAASLTRDRRDVIVEPGFRPVELWSFALAVREADSELRQQLDRAVRALVDGGTLPPIFGRYHVPYVAPARRSTQDGS